MQANALAHGPKPGQSIDKFFDEIAVKLDEICFRNAYFLKRLHAQIPTMTEVTQINTNEQKLELVRFVFSTCILVNIFGQAVLNRSKVKGTTHSRLCLDNIQECINRADAICDSEPVKQLVMQASGCDHSEVSLALLSIANTTHKREERVENLKKVFVGAIDNLPSRKYEKIFKQMEDVDDPGVQENFLFD